MNSGVTIAFAAVVAHIVFISYAADVDSGADVASGRSERVGFGSVSSYMAATVQRESVKKPNGATALEHKMMNFNATIQYVQTASSNSAAMIVLPEFAFGGDFKSKAGMVEYAESIPAPGPDVLPCNSSSEDFPLTSALACLAQKHNITIVANVVDNNSTGKVYNTEIVLDYRGTLIAKYYKYHPFFTSIYDKPPLELVSFEVDQPALKGIRFGLFVCFDIVFPDPAVDLVKQGVRNFPYSIAMDSIIGSGAEKLWSWVHDTNLLVADAGTGHGGLYSHGEFLPSTHVRFEKDQDGLLVYGKVPVTPV